jgi:hypothetical protein
MCEVGKYVVVVTIIICFQTSMKRDFATRVNDATKSK